MSIYFERYCLVGKRGCIYAKNVDPKNTICTVYKENINEMHDYGKTCKVKVEHNVIQADIEEITITGSIKDD
jgi:hypothetical protein